MEANIWTQETETTNVACGFLSASSSQRIHLCRPLLSRASICFLLFSLRLSASHSHSDRSACLSFSHTLWLSIFFPPWPSPSASPILSFLLRFSIPPSGPSCLLFVSPSCSPPAEGGDLSCCRGYRGVAFGNTSCHFVVRKLTEKNGKKEGNKK